MTTDRGPGRRRSELIDSLRELWIDLAARPGRTIMTAAGTIIGIAVLISTLTLVSSASAKITSRFNEYEATRITVTPVRNNATEASTIPLDEAERLARIDGVVASGRMTTLDDLTVTGNPAIDTDASTDLVGATPGIFPVVGAQVSGSTFNDWHNEHGAAVAVVGRTLARDLALADPSLRPVIFVDDMPLVVIGVLDQVESQPELLTAVIVPEGFLAALPGYTGIGSVVVQTRIGAAQVVGDQVAVALRPDQPSTVKVLVPPSLAFTRQEVSQDTQGLLYMLAAISLGVGGVGIANVTLIAVTERIPELGLRRALGATRRRILNEVLGQSALLGFLGGLAGAAAGILVAVAVALARDWPAVITWWQILLAPPLGGLIGLLAGWSPARRASRIDPIEAMRVAG